MSEDNDKYGSKIPEFNAIAALHQRLAQKPASKSSFDPHELMVKRRQENTGEIASDHPVHHWPEEDVKKLTDFCQRMGIVGFNCGNMSPLAALALLKQKLGVVDEFPKSEGYGPNYPYTEAMRERILLKG